MVHQNLVNNKINFVSGSSRCGRGIGSLLRIWGVYFIKIKIFWKIQRSCLIFVQFFVKLCLKFRQITEDVCNYITKTIQSIKVLHNTM